MRSQPFRVSPLPSIGVLLAALLAGCHGGSETTSAQLNASATVPAPGLVKLAQGSSAGSRLVVDVVLHGPEPALDLLGFRFGVKIDDPTVVRFSPQATYAQTALVAGAGQTIAMRVDGSDPAVVLVEVEKDGGGTGNGLAGGSAIVVALPFDVLRAGVTGLTLVGVGAGEPQAFDSRRAPIAAVTFDSASASVMGVTTGGGGY